MECLSCTVNGNELVYMTINEYDESTGANIVRCPRCGREEIIGFGRIR